MIAIELKTISDPHHAPDDTWRYYELRVGDLVIESDPFRGDDPFEQIHLLRELVDRTEDEIHAQSRSSHR